MLHKRRRNDVLWKSKADLGDSSISSENTTEIRGMDIKYQVLGYHKHGAENSLDDPRKEEIQCNRGPPQ